MDTNDWRVLLIGGHSGAGKTYLAQELGRKLGIPFLMVDDIRIALQQVTTPEQQPDLHVFLHYRLEQWLQPESIVQDWLRVGNALIEPLKNIMAHHIVVGGSGKLIIEGDGILPALAAPTTFSDLTDIAPGEIEQKVKAVFLIEAEAKSILNNLRNRGRGISAASAEAQRAFAHASWLFGHWLAREARANHLPVLSLQPKETVLERLGAIISS